MSRIIIKRQLPYHPLLGRNVNHDSESRRYAIPERDVEIKTVQHKRYAPFFDQGQLGSCTGNAGDGCTCTGLFFQSLGGVLSQMPKYGWNETGAVKLYGRATALDDYQGTYPPDDTGSDGLSVAKALKEAGEISGYLWAFTAEQSRAALIQKPDITGIPWLNNMFNYDETGKVDVSGEVAGGHEIVRAGYVMVGSKPSDDDQVWFDNSWGDSWGVARPGQGTAGSFWMPWGAYTGLLSDQGDVTQFVEVTAPAPDPTPDPDDPGSDIQIDVADRALAAAVTDWARKVRPSQCLKARKAVRTWLDTKGL